MSGPSHRPDNATILINGEWTTTGEEVVATNPADTSDVVGTVTLGTEVLVSDAGAAAAHAASAWKADPGQRSSILYRVADTLDERRDELARLAVREQGKTYKEAAGEVDRGAATFRFFAGEALQPIGEVMSPIKPGAHSFASHVPLGPVALITPFNFPILVPCWKLAPALAYGNTVVWKPSELTSLTAAALADALVSAGVPAGVINLVSGGPDVGAGLVALPEIRAISFTGSTAVGRAIQNAAAGRSVALQLEMGGKNPAVVLDDAPLDFTAAGVMKGIVGGTGQRCTALSRAIVPRHRLDEFLSGFEAAGNTWRMGNGLSESTMAGPLTTKSSLERVGAALETASLRGAEILTVGSVASSDEGWWCRPSIVTNVDPTDPIAQDELFGPVLAVLAHDGFDHAVELANATPFGLNAAVYTNDLTQAMKAVEQLDVGMAQVNADAGVAAHVPFVGVGDSGFGAAEQSSWARSFFTRPKVVNIHPAGGT